MNSKLADLDWHSTGPGQIVSSDARFLITRLATSKYELLDRRGGTIIRRRLKDAKALAVRTKVDELVGQR